MCKTTFFWLLLICWQANVFATGDSLRYLTPQDTVFLSIDAGGEKIFEHYIERGQTLFSLAKFYGLSLEQLSFYNPGLRENSVTVGRAVRVPIPGSAILTQKPKDFKPTKYVPVVYVVKRGDTIFGIAKRCFQVEIAEVMQRNQLTTETLHVGQRLLMGWMSIDGIPTTDQESESDPLWRRGQALCGVYQSAKGNRKDREHQGVAFWQKESREDLDLFALHREAAANSIIEVSNPMSQISICVKVVGRIPDTAYDNNVIVVLSPAAAKLLGAKDARFFVRVRYY